jgi:hypothetical protein
VRKISIGWLAWGVAGAVVLAACSGEQDGAVGAGAATTTRSVSTDSFGKKPSTPPPVVQPYAFFIASRDPSGTGYDLAAVNGAPFECGRQTAATACYVSSIDLSVFDLASSDAKTILAQVGRDPTSPTLLFLGSVSGGALLAQEIWRAPAAVTLSGTVLQVSHAPAQALVVNSWAATSIGALDFTSASKSEYCVISDAGTGQACSQSYVPVDTDVVSSAGVILAGREGKDGTLHVQQYFLKISTGYDDNSDGYSYCAAGQQLCPDNKCYFLDGGSCIGVHWGGRGEISVYVRATAPTVQSWLLSTGQLHPTDS